MDKKEKQDCNIARFSALNLLSAYDDTSELEDENDVSILHYFILYFFIYFIFFKIF